MCLTPIFPLLPITTPILLHSPNSPLNPFQTLRPCVEEAVSPLPDCPEGYIYVSRTPYCTPKPMRNPLLMYVSRTVLLISPSAAPLTFPPLPFSYFPSSNNPALPPTIPLTPFPFAPYLLPLSLLIYVIRTITPLNVRHPNIKRTPSPTGLALR